MNRRSFHKKSNMAARLLRIAASLLFVLTFMGISPAPQQAQAQTPRIVASIAGDWFWTTDFTGGAELMFWIYESPDPGAALLWGGSKMADDWGFVLVESWEHEQDLQPGNYLVVSDGSTTKELVLDTITMEVFDNFAELMAGTAPPGSPVMVSAGTQNEQTSMEVWADSLTGAWTADFTTLPFDITEEMRPWSYAQIFDGDGDANEADPPWLPGVWRDDFDGEVLGEPWYWIEENPGTWSLSENPGFLRIDTTPYPTGGENLLLRPPDLDYFVIQTHLLFEPVSNFQIAGLVVWEDEDEFLQLGRAYCDVPGTCAGNAIYFDYASGSGFNDNFATPVGSSSEAYLRLEFRGGEAAAFYAEDGIHWNLIGVHELPEDFSVNGIGLTASQNYFGVPPAPAYFDYFALAPLAEGFPVIRASTQDDHLRVDDFTPNSHVNFRVYEFPGAPDPLLDTGAGTDATGYTNIAGWQHSLDLVPGNFVVASDGLITKELALVHVTLDSFDTDNDLLAGTAPLDRAVWVDAGWSEYNCAMEVFANQPTTEPDIGGWVADFSDCDIVDEMSAVAQVFDEDADQTEVGRPSPPLGYHDYDSGEVPRWACNAGGWAMDPDAPFSDVNVRVLVDGEQVAGPFPAENYRPDLEQSWNEGGGGCPGGTCAFEVSLWGMVTPYTALEVSVEAQDLQSGEWHPLFATPRTLTCRTYDIYAFDPQTGQTRQLTDLHDSDEYNPSWSPNGKKIAMNTVYEDGSVGITIVDLKSGVSQPLAGAEQGGSWAAWSPNGQKIAFDFSGRGQNDLYIVPASGGVPVLVREDAITADWAPNGKRLVFQQPSDGSIWASGLSGEDPVMVVTSGANPDWSPDGRWVAYQDGGDLWKVAVTIKGELVGEPIRLTSVPSPDGHPSWSPDSQTIVFHAGHEHFDYDLWTVPAVGGEPSWLTGVLNFGDYDPAYAANSTTVAYASLSPDGQAPRTWVAAYTLDLPSSFWTEGEHSYRFHWGDGESGGDVRLMVDTNAPLYEGVVLLRPGFQLGRIGDEVTTIDAINPEQRTIFLAGWTADGTYSDAQAYFADLWVGYSWDDHHPVNAVRQEIIPFHDETWWSYVNSFTYPDFRTINIGNFSVEWSPDNPEEVSSLRWRGSENLSNPWLWEFFGNAWTLENEADDFFMTGFVGWSMAGGWTQNGTQVGISSINLGAGFPDPADIPVQTTYQFYSDPSRANQFKVTRTIQFGDTPYEHTIRPFIPRIYPRDGFTQVIYPDASGTNLVARSAEECEFGCEFGDWNGTWYTIFNLSTGMGMIVFHEPSPYPVTLWIDVDGGSYSNATSVMLLPPEGGFTGDVVESEVIYFFDSSVWMPSLALPSVWTPTIWLPVVSVP